MKLPFIQSSPGSHSSQNSAHSSLLSSSHFSQNAFTLPHPPPSPHKKKMFSLLSLSLSIYLYLSLSFSVTPPADPLGRFLDFVPILVVLLLFLFLLCCLDVPCRLSHAGKSVWLLSGRRLWMIWGGKDWRQNEEVAGEAYQLTAIIPRCLKSPKRPWIEPVKCCFSLLW